MSLVTREQQVDDNGEGPALFFTLDQRDDTKWICGGSYPSYKTIFDFLERQGVKTIVTLTLEPIKLGRNINHQHEETWFGGTQWCEADLEEKDLHRFEFVHIPISDTGFPTDDNADKIRQVAERLMREQKKTYFHCWAGRGRTCTTIIYVLMQLCQMNYDQAHAFVREKCEHILLTGVQEMFLKGTFDENDRWTKFVREYHHPFVDTPAHHRCFEK